MAVTALGAAEGEAEAQTQEEAQEQGRVVAEEAERRTAPAPAAAVSPAPAVAAAESVRVDETAAQAQEVGLRRLGRASAAGPGGLRGQRLGLRPGLLLRARPGSGGLRRRAYPWLFRRSAARLGSAQAGASPRLRLSPTGSSSAWTCFGGSALAQDLAPPSFKGLHPSA